MSKQRKLICRVRQENGAGRASGLIHSVASKGGNRRKGQFTRFPGTSQLSWGPDVLLAVGSTRHSCILVLNPLLLKEA